MKKTEIQPTVEQLEVLTRLQSLLGERGYMIAPVAVEYRRHESDFVAIPKDRAQHFAVVRAARTCIVIRPFGETRGELYRILPNIRREILFPVRRGLPQLANENAEPFWRQYADASAHEELELIGNFERTHA